MSRPGEAPARNTVKVFRVFVLSILMIGGAPFANAAGVGTEAQERERIASERAAAQLAFGSREHDCQNSFVVTPCVETARRDLREVLARLRRQEAILDEMQRRERAAQRIEASRNRPVAAELAASDVASVAPRARTRPAAVPHQRANVTTDKGKAAARAPAHDARSPQVSAAQRRVAEEHKEQEFEAAARAAKSRKAEIEQRNAARAASGKGAAPLPVPAGASAP
jgi:colicin import membrane protein